MSIAAEVLSIISEFVPSIDVEVVSLVDVEVVPSIDVEVMLSVDVEVVPLMSASSTQLSSPYTCCSSPSIIYLLIDSISISRFTTAS